MGSFSSPDVIIIVSKLYSMQEMGRSRAACSNQDILDTPEGTLLPKGRPIPGLTVEGIF